MAEESKKQEFTEDLEFKSEFDEEYGSLETEEEHNAEMAYLDALSVHLRTLTMNELFERVFVGGKAVIENLLYSGAYIFAGAPKVGKSFLMGQLAYHVSRGTDFWGHKVNRGTVLYLALEDDFRRLQSRMYKMFGDDFSEDLHFCTVSAQLGTGLLEQLDQFTKENPDTKLIIIDTLQKIREESENNYSYTEDYKIMGELKKFADEHDVCVIAVHHTRKMQSNDKFEMISGTTGILGCADGAFVMTKDERSEGFANLSVVGRDQPDLRLRLVRNAKTLCWELDYEEEAVTQEGEDPFIGALKKLLSKSGRMWIGSPTKLSEELEIDISPLYVTRKLNVFSSELMEKHHIKYFRRKKGSERIVELHDLTELFGKKEKEKDAS